MRCPRTPKAASPLRMAATRPLLVWLLLALLIPTLLLCSGGGAHAAVGAVSFRSKAAVSWRTFGDSARTAKPHLMAAAAARFVSISACYPIDTIKTRLQMGSAAAADSMKGGMAGMYLGLGGSLFGQVPYGMLAFGTYEMYKAALLEKFPGVPQAFTFCAAAILGDLTGSLWLVPSEVVKVQMQGGLHSSFSAATVSIFTKSGIGGFYQGIGGQVVRDVPFRAIQLTSYELLKNLHRAWRKKSVAMEKKHDDNNGNDNNNDQSSKPEFSAGDSALLGGIAGAISATFTCPLDVIRTRLMVGAQEGGTAAGGAGTWAGAIKEGGLFAGVGTRIFYVGVSSAIFFVVYESVKQQIFLTRATTAGVGGGGSAKSERATR